tara:strand:+ start:3808 stop:4953 length:1146 start_codon:yes stop_codon:yes gene_type:complete
MSEIVIERDDPMMDLNDSEQAILDEIEIDPRPLRVPKRQHVAEEFDDGLDEPDAFMNDDKRNNGDVPGRSRGPPPDEDDVIDHGETYEQFDPGAGGGGGFAPTGEAPTSGFASIDDEKADILSKLQRLSQKKGMRVNSRLNMYSSIDELRAEIKRAKYSIDVDQSVKFSKRMLVACVTGLEFMNKRYDPFDLKLEGWSESVMENGDDYDEVFEDLFVKYRSSVNVPPEVRLIMMVGGSGMMFHLTNSMFKSMIPNVNDIMKQNPNLMGSMMSAVQNTVASGSTDPRGPPAAVDTQGRREMKGPGIDIGSLMAGFNMPVPPQPVNTYNGDAEHAPPMEDEDMSDIISVVSDQGDVKDLNLNLPKRKRGGGRKKKSDKNEINI